MAAEHDLSAAARHRMGELLPDLLGALRARARRARLRRTAAVAAVLALPFALWPYLRATPDAPVSPVPLASSWGIVHDDPQVLARCEVRPVPRAEWFLGDDGLQSLLRAADKPAGLVRAGDRVFVSAAAIDPWGSEAP